MKIHPSTLAPLINLQALGLSCARWGTISNLPDLMNVLVHNNTLRFLYVAECKLQSIPDNVVLLSNLFMLAISDNPISALRHKMDGMRGLRTL